MFAISKNPCPWPSNSMTVNLLHFTTLLHIFHRPKTSSNMATQIERNPFQQSGPIDSDRFSNAMKAITTTRDLQSGLAFHAQAIKSLFGFGFVSVWNKFLNLYGQCGCILSSRQLFDKMPERDTVSFNTLISTYIRHGNFREALRLYSRMGVENLMPDRITLSTLFAACAARAALKLIEQFHAHAVKHCLNFDELVGSSLVDSYSKCLKPEEGKRAFDEIAELDLISWNIMISGFAHNGCEDQALKLFAQMRRTGVKFDSFTLTSLLMACSKVGDFDTGMQLHCYVLKSSLDSETPIGNALITMCSKCEAMCSATQVFQRIPEPNIISWTAMISGFTQNGMNKEAIGFYHKMLRQGVKENEFSFASILPAYGNLASLQLCKQIHARMFKSGFSSDISVGNAVIDAYSKCGSIDDAESVFVTMENHDLVSCTVMIGAFGQHGKGREALRIFDAMEREGLRPDGITFVEVLSACSHGGLVDEGLRVFQSMMDFHGVEPRDKHYTCVVDMLGRAGRLKEAEGFIREMSLESEAYVWEALLGACRIHGDKELGLISAQKVMELKPERDGPYVQLSNIYAERGMWNEKEKLRERLDASGLRKEAGWSWVEASGMATTLKCGTKAISPPKFSQI